jgi:hypothetical protein
MRLILFFTSITLLFSCGDPVGKAQFTGPFFSISDYFKEQAEKLSKSGISLQKKLIKDGKEEFQLQHDVDWEVQLRPFLESDINKPAYIRSYATDTIFLDNEMKVVYKALESDLPVQLIELTFSDEICKKVAIEKLKDNAIYVSKQHLVFELNKGHTISGKIRVQKLLESNYFISAAYINSN